ncbi:MAG: DUF2769 domain-containing protein [Candidatus Lokiarchaeota archaeon]|nr:DUF2769 domain-containing protein [Candidatus Lokiarchaeota archaeon]
MSDLEENFKSLPFEEKIKMMDMMSEKQKKESFEQVEYICRDYCGKCPTLKDTGETNLAFCSIGKSLQIVEEKECLCGQCPITKTMSLRWKFYCTRGSALDLSNAEK